MPTIRDFENQTKNASKTRPAKAVKGQSVTPTKPKVAARKRRPGRVEGDPMMEQQTHSNGAAPESVEKPQPEQEAAGFSSDPETTEAEKIRLEFTGSEYLRDKAPKVFEFAEIVADEWVKDGRFEGLPVGHPMAQMAAQATLLQAKKIEKKLEEKGVFALAKMGVAYAKSKLGRR